MKRIYCAGPLFNEFEKNEMCEIAATLESVGYVTFLPQRDGLELARILPELLGLGVDSKEAGRVVNRAIFCFDVHKLLAWSDAVVANLNGRVPDEGTVVEAALAWHARKPLVLYKNDSRAPFIGNDNPMLTGLSGFRIIANIIDLPVAIEEGLQNDQLRGVEESMLLGEELIRVRGSAGDTAGFARYLLGKFGITGRS